MEKDEVDIAFPFDEEENEEQFAEAPDPSKVIQTFMIRQGIKILIPCIVLFITMMLLMFRVIDVFWMGWCGAAVLVSVFAVLYLDKHFKEKAQAKYAAITALTTVTMSSRKYRLERAYIERITPILEPTSRIVGSSFNELRDDVMLELAKTFNEAVFEEKLYDELKMKFTEPRLQKHMKEVEGLEDILRRVETVVEKKEAVINARAGNRGTEREI